MMEGAFVEWQVEAEEVDDEADQVGTLVVKIEVLQVRDDEERTYKIEGQQEDGDEEKDEVVWLLKIIPNREVLTTNSSCRYSNISFLLPYEIIVQICCIFIFIPLQWPNYKKVKWTYYIVL